jgi:hypothetical protein
MRWIWADAHRFFFETYADSMRREGEIIGKTARNDFWEVGHC